MRSGTTWELNMSQFKEALGTKKLVAIVVVISSIVAFSTFMVLDNSRKEEEKARIALEQQRLEEIQLTHQTKVCGAFGNSLNLLTANKFSFKKMRETNSLLDDYLKAWSVDDGTSNGVHTKLTKYRGVIEQSLAGSGPKESKEFLTFQESNFNYLIRACKLDDSYTYPASITFLSGCSFWQVKNLRLELQEKSSSNTWRSLSVKDGEETKYCLSNENPGYSVGSHVGADFAIPLGLVRNNMQSYGTYRVRWSFKDSQRFVDGSREIYSCEFKATKPDQTLYPEFTTYQDVLGCDGEGNPDYVGEPDM
jgi:type II secretory pathway pseudopilin PulG